MKIFSEEDLLDFLAQRSQVLSTIYSNKQRLFNLDAGFIEDYCPFKVGDYVRATYSVPATASQDANLASQLQVNWFYISKIILPTAEDTKFDYRFSCFHPSDKQNAERFPEKACMTLTDLKSLKTQAMVAEEEKLVNDLCEAGKRGFRTDQLSQENGEAPGPGGLLLSGVKATSFVGPLSQKEKEVYKDETKSKSSFYFDGDVDFSCKPGSDSAEIPLETSLAKKMFGELLDLGHHVVITISSKG